MTAKSAVLTLVACATAFCQTANPPTELILKAKVRDFREGNNTGIPNHPNFYGSLNNPPCDAQALKVPTVADDLDTTDLEDTAVFRGDKRGPRLLPVLSAAMAACFDPPARFLDWYNDRDTSVNRPVLIDLKFTYDAATGAYGYDDQSFFPVNDGGAYAPVGAAAPFGDLIRDGNANNYGFTLEFHTGFTYQKGKNQVFNFRGDDDVWVFINGKKVIDLGGIHNAETALLNLDSIAPAIGIADGKNYPLDFFYAERHCCSSSMRISTSLEFQPLLELPKPVLPPSQVFRDVLIAALDSMIPGAIYHYTTDGSPPDSGSPVYTSSLVLTETTTLRVVAVKPGWKDSPVATGAYTLMGRLPTPVATPVGSFEGSATVTVMVPGDGEAILHCTVDGTDPTAASPVYAGPLTLTADAMLKCKASETGWVDSKIMVEPYARLAAATRAVYLDGNGDGRIDAALIFLDIAPAGLPASVSLIDPFTQANTVYPAADISMGPVPNSVWVRFPDKPFAPGTAFPAGAYGRFPDVPGYGPHAFTVSDSAGPVPVQAVSHNKTSPEDRPFTDVTFSEPVDLAALQAGASWPFVILREGAVETRSVVVVSIEAVAGRENTYRWTFSAGSPAYPVYIDSLALAAAPAVRDPGGSPGVAGGERIPVEGEKQTLSNPLDIKVTNAIVVEKDNLSVTYPDAVYANPFAVVGSEISNSSVCLDCKAGTEAVFLQPRLYPEWVVRSKYGFHYTFQVFDNLGQFVSKTTGEVTTDMVDKLPPDATGFRNLRFRWIPLAKDRSKAATGAYILKGLVMNSRDERQKGAQGEDQTLQGSATTVLLTFGYLRQK